MIDSIEKRNCWMSLNLQHLHVVQWLRFSGHLTYQNAGNLCII